MMTKIQELASKVTRAKADFDAACARHKAVGEALQEAGRQKREAEDLLWNAERELVEAARNGQAP